LGIDEGPDVWTAGQARCFPNRDHEGSLRHDVTATIEEPKMINEVDASLRNLVSAEVANGTDVEVLFEAPTRDWASRRNSPTIDLFLYDIREDTKRRTVGRFERRDERGAVVERLTLPRYFKLAYLMTAWTQRPEDEHRLLSAIVTCFVRFDVIPQSALTPLLRERGCPIALQFAYPPPEDRQVSDVWTSLGGDLKASIDLVVTLPIQPESAIDIATKVMEPLRLHTRAQKTLDVEDDVRQLRSRSIDEESAEVSPPKRSEVGTRRRKQQTGSSARS
jgi:hypothetical protein